jgi:hypothetical protein
MCDSCSKRFVSIDRRQSKGDSMNSLFQCIRRLIISILLILCISFAMVACQPQSAKTDATNTGVTTATAFVSATVSSTTTPVTQTSASIGSALTSANVTGSTVQASTTVSTTTVPATTVSATTVPATKLTGTFVAADLVLTIEGQSFAMMNDAAPLLKKLGDKYQKAEAESCLFKGFDKTFDYGFLQVFTIPNEKLDLLDGIYIMDNRYQTARGIKVGDTQASVIAAYGKKTGTGGLVYNKTGDPDNLADPSLTFVFEGDKVVAISYYSGSNSQGTAGGG